MAPTIFVLNGPNLNLLGTREPETYGRTTLAEIEAACRARAAAFGFQLRFEQTNAEGTLVDQIQEAREAAAGIVINPAAYTHTSVAIRDALAACACPVIEVHLSNVHAREPFRHHSYVSPVAAAVIAGCGAQGYDFAIERLAALVRAQD
jgi:3-dehydroquinate dehydratase-2